MQVVVRPSVTYRAGSKIQLVTSFATLVVGLAGFAAKRITGVAKVPLFLDYLEILLYCETL